MNPSEGTVPGLRDDPPNSISVTHAGPDAGPRVRWRGCLSVPGRNPSPESVCNRQDLHEASPPNGGEVPVVRNKDRPRLEARSGVDAARRVTGAELRGARH